MRLIISGGPGGYLVGAAIVRYGFQRVRMRRKQSHLTAAYANALQRS